MNDLARSAWLFPLRLAAFWLGFFGLFRCWFLAQHFEKKGAGATAGELFQSFSKGFALDFSMAGYAVSIPVLLWLLGFFVRDPTPTPPPRGGAFESAGPGQPANFLQAGKSPSPRGRGWSGVALGFSVLLVAAFVALAGANVFLYAEWDSVIGRRAMSYLASPRALLDSMSPGLQVLCVLLWLGATAFFGWILKKLVFVEPSQNEFGTGFSPQKSSVWAQVAAFPISLGLVFLMMRGSLGVMPINESAAFFSDKMFLNHAAVNPIWRLGHDLVESRATKNPFVFMEKAEAEQLVKPLFETDFFCSLGERRTPNVVLIIMESMTSQLLAEKGLCPNLERLASEGVFFSQIYSSGFRTDQGLVSILAGYPAQPDQSIMMLPDKAEKLPSLPRAFRNSGYETAFFYGGQLTFANVGQFLRTQGFQKIISETDFSAAEKRQKWGADDETLLARAASEISKMKEPFFAAALTLSLHTPFDVPGSTRVAGEDAASKFRNSAAFADAALGQFFEKVKSEKWFDNTLFVVVADHGHGLPGGVAMHEAESRHIPLVFWKKDLYSRQIDRLGCQHDLPMLFNEIFAPRDTSNFFSWSKDLYCQPIRSYAYWSNEVGLGWKNADGEHFYDFSKKEWAAKGEIKKPAPREAQAFLQLLYEDFLAK